MMTEVVPAGVDARQFGHVVHRGRFQRNDARRIGLQRQGDHLVHHPTPSHKVQPVGDILWRRDIDLWLRLLRPVFRRLQSLLQLPNARKILVEFFLVAWPQLPLQLAGSIVDRVKDAAASLQFGGLLRDLIRRAGHEHHLEEFFRSSSGGQIDTRARPRNRIASPADV